MMNGIRYSVTSLTAWWNSGSPGLRATSSSMNCAWAFLASVASVSDTGASFGG